MQCLLGLEEDIRALELELQIVVTCFLCKGSKGTEPYLWLPILFFDTWLIGLGLTDLTLGSDWLSDELQRSSSLSLLLQVQDTQG